MIKKISFAFFASLLCSSGVWAYPNGTPHYVTDVGPYCAACHTATQRDTMRGMGAKMAEGELAVYKHLLPIKERREAYQGLSSEEAKQLLEYVQKVDEHARITLEAPKEISLNGEVTVTASFQGGVGPVVGLMLLDSNLRWESRSPTADGWEIVGEPQIFGPDGKTQTKFLDHRTPGLKRNLNYVMIEGISADVEKKIFSQGRVVWKMRPPRQPGTYTLAVAFLYGTEKGSKIGQGATIEGAGLMPRGGFEGHSGRIVFSEVQIVVK